MNTTNAAVGAGAITVIGRWSEGDDVDVRIVVGVVVLAMILSALPEPVAKPMSYLILVAVLFRYARGIIDRSGIAGPKRQKIVPGTVFERENRSRV